MDLAVVAAGCSVATTESLTSRWRNALSNNMFRRGASIIAAAAVTAGCLAVGMGTASGSDCQASGDLTQLRPRSIAGCLNYTHWSSGATAAGFTVAHSGPKGADTGEEVTFYSTISNTGDPSRGITKAVHHPPAGFVLKSVSSSRIRHVPAENRYYFEPVGLTSEVDPATGAVTLRDPSGRPLDILDGLSLSFTYEVRQIIGVGTSGVTFEATGVPETPDWLATGRTTVAPIGGAIIGYGS